MGIYLRDYGRWKGKKIEDIKNEIKIYQLEEKDTQTKLETLFKINLYDVAINLAQTQNYDPSSVADIYRRYADHLYGFLCFKTPI